MSEVIRLDELSPITQTEDAELAELMTDATSRLVDRHMYKVREWCPSEFITTHNGRSYKEQPWTAEKDRIMPVYAEAALRVNTLTEDNLTSYNHDIARVVEQAIGRPNPKLKEEDQHPLHVWSSHWTAEEDRHGRAMGLWINAHAPIDPVQLDKDRFALMRQVHDGTPQHFSLVEAVAYASIQELATQVSHRNTGKVIGNEAPDGRMHGGQAMLGVIAGDEGRHHNFYRDWTADAMQINPSVVLRAIARQIVEFDMPGTGIPNFTRQSVLIASSGIYGLKEYREVLSRVFEVVDVEDTQRKLSPEGRLAQLAIRQEVDKIDGKIAMQEQRAAVRAAKRAAQPSRS